MTRKEMISEIEDHVGKANMKILEMGKPDVISVFDDGEKISVSVGGTKKYDGEVSNITSLKKAKHAVWACVDEIRGFELPKATRVSDPVSELVKLGTFFGVTGSVEQIIGEANARLSEIVSGGFPYTMDDVKFSLSFDSAGLYVHSGNTPVISVARAGDPDGVIREIRSAVWETVDLTRSAVERRRGLKSEADALASHGEEVEKAVAALKAAGLSADLLRASAVPEEVAEAAFSAADEAVKEANKGLSLYFLDAVAALGGRDAVKLRIRRYAGGFVVEAGGKPCLVSRFPKTGSNKTVERMIAFIKADIAALGESRRRYLSEVRDAIERENRLHEIACRIDAADMALAAAM